MPNFSSLSLPPQIRSVLLKILAFLSVTIAGWSGFLTQIDHQLLDQMKQTDEGALVQRDTSKPVDFMWGKSWNGTLSCPADPAKGLVYNAAGQEFFQGGALNRDNNDFGNFTVLLDGRQVHSGLLWDHIIDLKGAKTLTLKPHTPGDCVMYGTFYTNP